MTAEENLNVRHGPFGCVSACNLDPLIGGIGVQSCPPCHEA